MKQAAVLGHPISHSKSPVLHRAAYQLLGVPISYSAIDLEPGDAAGHAAALRAGNWAGCSVTMPLKDAFVPQMDELSARVQRLGALNTVVVREDGTLYGENTDIDGLVQALADFGLARSAQAMVLGSGNTALAAIEAAAEVGARQLTLVVRAAPRAARAVELARELGMETFVHEISEIGQELAATLNEIPLVFSTLPPHAADDWVPAIGAGTGILLDVAYDPWPSALARSWQGTVISGLHMLVHQAVEQVRLFSAGAWEESRRMDVTNAMYDSLGLARHQ
ncbi:MULTISPECIES: shikimate dehydrogenase family protein [unclassified Glutamicibacter]|uniref:shikimate dehydrogenase family protein n=1 Tax=unclassified Glutamicibacter TaxID=2627139 RepID=UPI0037F8EBCD